MMTENVSSPEALHEICMVWNRAPYRSWRLTCYYNGLLDRAARDGLEHLPFTPPTTRGSLITRCEAWGLNNQRAFVPTLTDMRRWPIVAHDDHPDALSNVQAEWLKLRWGEVATTWCSEGWSPNHLAADVAIASKLHPFEGLAA